MTDAVECVHLCYTKFPQKQYLKNKKIDRSSFGA